MKYLIKIDRNSVRPNPRAGKDYYNVPGKREISYDESGNIVSVNFDVHKIYSIQPESEFLFEYEKTPVQCESCNAIFSHTELGCDEMGDNYSEAICPRCGDWNCCELEYEKLEEKEKTV